MNERIANWAASILTLVQWYLTIYFAEKYLPSNTGELLQEWGTLDLEGHSIAFSIFVGFPFTVSTAVLTLIIITVYCLLPVLIIDKFKRYGGVIVVTLRAKFKGFPSD